MEAKKGLVHAQMIAPDTGDKSEILIRVAKESFITGWQQAMWVGTGIMVLLLVYILFGGVKTESKILIKSFTDLENNDQKNQQTIENNASNN